MSGSIGGPGFDPTIPLRAGQGVPQFNPLSQAREFAETLNAFNRNEMFPGALQMQKQQIESNKTALTQQIRQAGYSSLVSLLGNKGPLTPLDTVRALGAFERAGGNSQPILRELTHEAPSDPVQYDAWLRARIASNSQTDPASAVRMVTPRGFMEDRGVGPQPFTEAPPGSPAGGAGVASPAGPIYTRTPSTTTMGSMVEYTGPDGKRVVEPWLKFAQDHGYDPANPPMSLPNGAKFVSGSTGGSSPRGEPPPLPAVGGGGTSAPAPAAAAPVAPPKPAAGGMTSTTGPGPGELDAAATSGKQFAADQTAAGSYQNRVLPLRSALRLIESGAQTGPGSETLNTMRSLAISLKNQGLLPAAITPNEVNQASFDELKKYFAQAITGMPFAGGSDARLAEAITGNPNVNISTMANKDLLKVLIGMERYRAAQYFAFQQAAASGQFGDAAKANPSVAAPQYGNFVAAFNQKYDPRAFAFDLMSAADRKRLGGSMKSEDERNRFRDSVTFAHELKGLMQ